MKTTANPLTEQDQFMIKNAEIAAERGSVMLSWWKSRITPGVLKRTFERSVRPQPPLNLACFYDTLELNGAEKSVMGCLWKSTFRPKQASAEIAAAPGAVRRPAFDLFIKEQFLTRAKWMHPNQTQAGFGFTPLQYKLKEGQFGSFAGASGNHVSSLAEIGTTYDWVVFQADVYDFFSDFPQIRRKGRTIPKFPRMASYVLVHNDFGQNIFPPSEGTVAESRFGYSFLPNAPYKNFIGYGPGRFEAAVKQFRFSLLRDGQVEIQLAFIVSPRSEKVLYLRGFDPVYGLVNLLNAVTFGLLKIKSRAHDRLDSVFLIQHAKVYQNLIDGMREVWETRGWADPDSVLPGQNVPPDSAKG